MILDRMGRLSEAQDLTSGQTLDSTNVIQLSTNDYANITDAWFVVDTETVATGDGSDTYACQLVAATEAALDTCIQLVSRTITGYASLELATAGKRFMCVNVGKMIKDVLGTSGSDYYILGAITAVSSGATWSVNISLSPTEPPTDSHSQVVTSNVGVPARCSAGS